jgi:hypothetical protein
MSHDVEKHIYLDRSSLNNYLSSLGVGILESTEQMSEESSEESFGLRAAANRLGATFTQSESEREKENYEYDIPDSYRFQELVDRLVDENLLYGSDQLVSPEDIDEATRRKQEEIDLYRTLENNPQGKFIRTTIDVAPISQTRLNIALNLKKRIYYNDKSEYKNEFDEIEKNLSDLRIASGDNLLMIGELGSKKLFFFTLNPEYMREPVIEAFSFQREYNLLGRIKSVYLFDDPEDENNDSSWARWLPYPGVTSLPDSDTETALDSLRNDIRQLPGTHQYVEPYELELDAKVTETNLYEVDPISIYW